MPPSMPPSITPPPPPGPAHADAPRSAPPAAVPGWACATRGARRAAAGATVLLALGACGGGSVSVSINSPGSPAPVPTPAPTPSPTPPPRPSATPPTAQEASRFLAQATFGATDASIARVQQIGYAAWIDEQMALPATAHTPYVSANWVAANFGANFNFMQDSFWQQAVPAPDQLRQRVKFALSQILVISASSNALANGADGMATYYDILGANAFGNYRTLLEAVSTSPMMGQWLTYLANQKGDAGSGRVPDENYAREVMQLMTIGLHQLNPDGTDKLVGGNPVETYGNADVTGLARVFTGWSWAAPALTSSAFFGNAAATYPDRNLRPMANYPQYHESGAKTFLGTTIAAGTDGPTSLRLALDTLFNHPNTCPFIGQQLIQRLVTSNPSPAYVGRVAAACADNGAGVRGDLNAMVRAILLDAEARDAARAADPQFGKLREPVVRLANWARCFNAASASGNWTIRNLDSAATSLGQQPLRAPSVFNFFRPGYTPPSTATAAAGLVAPEFQLVGETSVAGYANVMQSVVVNGVGIGTPRDVRTSYANEVAIADDATALVNRVDLCLSYGSLSTTQRQTIVNAVNAIAGGTASGRLNRVYTAVLLTMNAPDYLVQK